MLPDLDPTLSDIFILIALPFALFFVVSYGLGSPWYKVKQHGWIGVMTLLHSLSVAALLFLIVWGIIFGERVNEGVRLPVAVLLALALVAKVIILHGERRRGRIMRREHEKRKTHDPEQVPGGTAAGGDAVPGRVPGGSD